MIKCSRRCCRINVAVTIWFSGGFFFLNALDSAVLSFFSLSESLAILSDRYSSTVFQPPGHLSAILIILFRVSKSAIAFLMLFNNFLVKLFLIWRVIDFGCAMMESLKSSWSWLPLYLSLCGLVLIFLASLSFSFRASLNFESKQLRRSWKNTRLAKNLTYFLSSGSFSLRHFCSKCSSINWLISRNSAET